MNTKKRIHYSKVLSEPHSTDKEKDVILRLSSSPELLLFQNLLGQYKAKMFEQHAHLFQS